jgi:hypothetical protein
MIAHRVGALNHREAVCCGVGSDDVGAVGVVQQLGIDLPSARQRSGPAECGIHARGVLEHFGDVRVEKHHVRSLPGPPVVLPANAPSEIVRRTDVVSDRSSPLLFMRFAVLRVKRRVR